MSSSLDLSGWAGDIISDLNLSGVTTGSVVNWLQSNLGNLNLALRTNYYTGASGIYTGILPEMSQIEVNIYSDMYKCQDLNKKAVQAAQLGFTDWIEIDGKDQGSIRKVSKSELAKELRASKNDCNEALNQAIDWYRRDGPNPEGAPYQVYPLNFAPEPPTRILISGIIP